MESATGANLEPLEAVGGGPSRPGGLREGLGRGLDLKLQKTQSHFGMFQCMQASQPTQWQASFWDTQCRDAPTTPPKAS